MTRGLAGCRAADHGKRYETAEPDLEAAARLASQLDTAELTGEVSLRAGTCLFLDGDLSAAEARFREALGIARRGRLPFLETSATGSIGLIRMRESRLSEAADWLGQSADLASKLGAGALAVKTLGNLGWCYRRLGDYERALPLLSRAETLAEEKGLTGDLLIARNSLGSLLYNMGRYEAAAEQYRHALALSQQLSDRMTESQLLGNLGSVALAQGRYDAAEKYVRQALARKQALGDEAGKQYWLFTEGAIWAERGQIAKAAPRFREVISSPDADPELAWEARAALAALHLRAGDSQRADAEFRRALELLERHWDRLRGSEHRIAFLSSVRRFQDSYVDFLASSGRTEEALSFADSSRARGLRESLSEEKALAPTTPVRYARLARDLAATLLFYWTAPDRSYLWVVRPEGLTLHALPGEDTIRDRVEGHQALVLQSRDPLSEGTEPSTWLYDTLIRPAGLEPGARVILLPDGPLHQLNTETLVVSGERPRYWIEDATVAVAPSLSLLTAQGTAPPDDGARTLLAIGDAVPATDEFPALAHAGDELRRVAAAFPGTATIYAGAEADPSAYRRADPGRFDFIHFAAHATANPVLPLESAIVLSAKGDAYKLHARDIAGVPLTADVVTLSACRGAGSRVYAGEGMVGLAWAFLGSGAGSVVGGLWNVEDASTARLMGRVYEGLAAGLDAPAALRRAKLELIASGTAYRKPFYWAPFLTYVRAARASFLSDRP